MRNLELSKKIKELRTCKGYSQDELAQVSQLSLRTIQRIESGETEPRGDTLKRLAKALDVTLDELIDWTEHQDSRYLAGMNLSALSFIAFPLLGIIVPLAMWVLKKEKIKHVNTVGKRIINFQITWCICLCLIYIVVLKGISFQVTLFGLGTPELIILVFVALYAFNFIVILLNTVGSVKTMRVIYQPAIPFLR